MLQILGKPMIGRVIEDIFENGLTEFILVTSPNDRQINDYFQNECNLDIQVQFVNQPERRGMADALKYASPFIRGDFLLSACDNLISAQFVEKLLKQWNA